ncbi:hypothetical protein C6P40_001292 [Pichia californica]|uniref:SH3 domain-containing protein n=1 Tax=Pichia californica TaxID=460514 RepID=A0A9P6WJY1_9ASCO|nr:hypothetical protein C6P42_001354 [[Candida] californica]KAG0688199.1 hypothetical protein C6P40_001292 [[Candida] californica]
MTSVLETNGNLYAKSFWSVDQSAHDVLMLQNEKSTKTLNTLSTFYKECMHLENEYARKLSTLLNKLELPKHEYAGTLKTSLDVFQEQCMRISDSHSLQARRINDSLQQPLLELISDRKAREKAVEVKIKHAWMELLELKNKVDSKSIKYENIWSNMNSLKRTRMTLDNREAQKLEEKLKEMKNKMLIIREENYQLVNRYNDKLNSWLSLWWDTCNEWQISEENRIRFIKSNTWEFANIMSLFCVEEDQYAENMRISLQECSAKKDIEYFVSENSTGDNILAPLLFVDYAKNETRPLNEQTTRKFNVLEIPGIRNEITENAKSKQRKRNPPPPSNEETETAFSYIGKSKETFKELQEQAEKEVSQLKLITPEYNNSKSGSEPSTFKVMSDYSNPTTHTSISSHSYDESFEDKVMQYKKNQIDQNNLNVDNNVISAGFIGGRDNSESSKVISNPLRNALVTLKNSDKLRESMSPVKNDLSKKEKHNSFASIVKNTFNESPGEMFSRKFENRQIVTDVENSHSVDKTDKNEMDRIRNNNSLMIKNQKNTLLRASQRTVRNNSLKKSKSQMNLKDKHTNLSEFPSYSSEGYPVICYAKALYNYTAAIEEELSFKKRDVLLILHKQTDGWWFGENMNSGDSGLIPSNYLAEI